jgi:hypothetical protein
MKTVYAVYRTNDGALNSGTFEIEGKLNHLSVQKAIRDKSSYYNRNNFNQLISWQEEDEFTFEETQEFWNKF